MAAMMHFPMVSKIEAAHRQLSAAIEMFFADGDAVAVHTLTCAALEIYEKHCRRAGLACMFDLVKAGNPSLAEKELRNAVNLAKNFFKHDGSDLDERIEFDDSLNDFALLAACTDCATLCSPRQPAEVQAYTIWYLAVETPDDAAMTSADLADAAECRRVQGEIDRLYPGLRAAPRAEKKRFGARLLQDARSGKLVERGGPRAGDVPVGADLVIVGGS